MRRMFMEVNAFESPDLGAPSRYLKHILLNSRKNFRDLSSRRIHSKDEKISNQIWKFRDEF